MKNRSLTTLGILALLTAASAFGQQRLRFDIPFEFHFADKVMPAGEYRVAVGDHNERDLLSLNCYSCNVNRSVLTHGIDSGADVPASGRLVFNKYGATYFLSEVWTPGDPQGGAVSKSKTEREIGRATPDMARVTVPAGTSQVVIARR